jgi:hypothetical protein
MAVLTWLSRVASPSLEPDSEEPHGDSSSGDLKKRRRNHNELHALSDPMTHFALVFSALVHDCEHPGVSNGTLVNEQDKMAKLYKDKSIHEQASVDLAFDTLMQTKYAKLRKVLFATDDEFHRFRQIVINCVLSTDILDDRVMARQNVRWGCLFRDQEDEEPEDDKSPEDLLSEFEKMLG